MAQGPKVAPASFSGFGDNPGLSDRALNFAVVAESHVGMSQVLLRLNQWPRTEVMAPWTCQKVPLNASAPLCPTDMWPWQLLFQWSVRAFLCRRVLPVWHTRTTASNEVGVGFDL